MIVPEGFTGFGVEGMQVMFRVSPITVFHGSPDRKIRILKAGSFVTPHLMTAWIMGLYYPGRTTPGTWNDGDLLEPYKFGTGMPKFQPHLIPDGQPRIYQTIVRLDQLKDGTIDNPWEWRTSEDLPVMPFGHPSVFDPGY